MKKTYKDSELQDLLKAVETGIADLVKTEQEALAKANPGEETSDEAPADDSATSDAPADGGDSESAPPASDGPPAAAASAPPATDAPAAAPPADAAASADPAADQSADPAALQAEYAQLPPEDLKAHYIACKAALFAVMGAGAGDPGMDPGMDAGAPPAPAAAPPAPPAASPSAPPTLKGEKSAEIGPPNGENPLNKAQAEIVVLKEQVEKANKGMSDLMTVVETVLGKPRRKAITGLGAAVAKSEQKTVLTREQVKAKLKTLVSSKPLNKSDRELVCRFDLGTVSVEQVAHLLTDK